MAMARRDSVTVSIAAETMRDVQADVPRSELGLHVRLVGQDVGVTGDEEDVVEGQCEARIRVVSGTRLVVLVE